MATKRKMTEADYKAQYMAEWKETLEFLIEYPDAMNGLLAIKEQQFDLKSYKKRLKREAYYETEEYKKETEDFFASL